MRVRSIRHRLLQRVSDVLADGNIEDVLIMADQVRIVGSALAACDDDDDVDLSTFTIDTSQAARILSYHAEHVRRLIRQGIISATKTGSDYRIPINEILTLLVRRHSDEPIPALVPERYLVTNPSDAPAGLMLAIDVLLTGQPGGQTTRLHRLTFDLPELLSVAQPESAAADAGASALSD